MGYFQARYNAFGNFQAILKPILGAIQGVFFDDFRQFSGALQGVFGQFSGH
jgi:hypothetical protein